jgi:hypothetical protein
MNERRRPVERGARARSWRAPRRPAVLVGALVATLLAAGSTPAGAAIGPFQVQPGSGPPGTPVTITGSGCGPGLVRVPSQDYVSVSSTTLPLGLQVAVSANGSWSTTFTVPLGAPAVPAALTALCFTDGLPSLTTVYTPGTFFVTAPTTPAPPPPPTSPSTTGTPSTTQGTTTTTEAGSNAPGGGAGSASPGGTTGAATRGGRAGGADGLLGTSAPASGEAGGPDAVAGLRSPELTSDATGAPGGVGWGWWLLLLALVAGAAGAWFWARRRHVGPPAEPAGTDGPPDDGGGGEVPPAAEDDLGDAFIDDIPVSTS